MEDRGIELRLEPYCSFCPYFEPDVEKIDATVMSDKVPRVLTAIRCENRSKCEQIRVRLQNGE